MWRVPFAGRLGSKLCKLVGGTPSFRVLTAKVFLTSEKGDEEWSPRRAGRGGASKRVEPRTIASLPHGVEIHRTREIFRFSNERLFDTGLHRI